MVVEWDLMGYTIWLWLTNSYANWKIQPLLRTVNPGKLSISMGKIHGNKNGNKNGNGKSMGTILMVKSWWKPWLMNCLMMFLMGDFSDLDGGIELKLHQNKQKLPSLVTGCHRLWLVSDGGFGWGISSTKRKVGDFGWFAGDFFDDLWLSIKQGFFDGDLSWGYTMWMLPSGNLT